MSVWYVTAGFWSSTLNFLELAWLSHLELFRHVKLALSFVLFGCTHPWIPFALAVSLEFSVDIQSILLAYCIQYIYNTVFVWGTWVCIIIMFAWRKCRVMHIVWLLIGDNHCTSAYCPRIPVNTVLYSSCVIIILYNYVHAYNIIMWFELHAYVTFAIAVLY